LAGFGLWATRRDHDGLAAAPRSWLLLVALTTTWPWLYLVPLPEGVVARGSPRLASERAASLIGSSGDQELIATEAALFGSSGESRPATGAEPLGVDRDAVTLAALRHGLWCACFLLAWSVGSTPAARRLLAAAIGASALLQAAYGLAESLSKHHQILGVPKRHYLPLPSGTFICPNHWAALLALGLFTALGLLAVLVRRDERDMPARTAQLGLVGTGLGVIGIALLWSSSRAALGAAGFAALVMAGAWFLRARTPDGQGARSGSRVGLALALLVALLAMIGAWLIRPPDPLQDDLARVSQDLVGRSRIWQAAWNAHTAFPWFGSGPGTYPVVQASFRPHDWPVQASHAHNDYLQWLVETGWIGLPLLLAWIALCGFGAIAVHRRARDHELTAALAAALLSLALHELVDFSLQLGGVAIPAALLAGALLAPLPWGPATRPTPRPLHGTRTVMGLVIALVWCAAALVTLGPRVGLWTSSNAERRAARSALQELTRRASDQAPLPPGAVAQGAAALRAARRAVELAPLRAEAALSLWFAAQTAAAVRGAEQDLPRGFERYSIHWLQRAEALDPADRERRVTLLKLWLASGETARAVRLARGLLEDAPDRAAEVYRLLTGASLELADLMAATPNQPVQADGLVEYLLRAGDQSAAGIVLQRAHGQHPDDPTLRLRLSAWRSARGDDAAALDLLANGSPPAALPLRRAWWNHAAWLAARTQSREAFDAALAELIASDEDPRVLGLQRARFAERAGQPLVAIGALREALREPEREWEQPWLQREALAQLGRLLAAEGDFSAALPYFRTLQRLAPDDPSARAFFAMLGEVR
jgi:O-antigen ligase/tetratricopeptide (TPR) repeat protein